MNKNGNSIFKKVNEFCSENIAVSLLSFVGSVFIFGWIIKILFVNPPYQGFFLLAYWVAVIINTIWGSIIFAYNICSTIFI